MNSQVFTVILCTLGRFVAVPAAPEAAAAAFKSEPVFVTTSAAQAMKEAAWLNRQLCRCRRTGRDSDSVSPHSGMRALVG